MRNKTIKIAIMLFIIIIATILATNNTYAAGTVASGTGGKEITWTLDTNGVLTISGKRSNGKQYN